MAIFFYTEPPLVFQLKNKLLYKRWLNKVVQIESNEQKKISNLNYIFCSDDYLHDMNKEYLQHDTLTDVITFDNSEKISCIAGDIFISIDRIKDNAVTYKVDVDTELRRVMVHGLLHLLGYGDKTDAEIQLMRTKENDYLLHFGNIDA